MKAHHEHEFEAAPGLPEPLPPGERILWQGAPNARELALRVYHVRELALYFAAILVWQCLELARTDTPEAWRGLAVGVALALSAFVMVVFVAWMAARTTLYTLTDRRVVMRIGIVLTITLNLPYRRLSGASVRRDRSGSGDIALELAGNDRMGWLHLWPHARPWQLRRPQPSLRCLADVDAVSALLVQGWRAANPGAAARFGESAAQRPGRVQGLGAATHNMKAHP